MMGKTGKGPEGENQKKPTVQYLVTEGLNQSLSCNSQELATRDDISWRMPIPDAIRAWHAAQGQPPLDESKGSVCQVYFIDKETTPLVLGSLRTPRYAVDRLGVIRHIDPVFLIHHESLESILRATQMGYNGCQPKKWLVVEHLAPGFGGATEFTDFLLFMGAVADAGAIYKLLPAKSGAATSYVTDRWNGLRYRRERHLAFFWEASQGIATAKELRECVDDMSDRSPRLLCERLSLKSEASGRRLLRLLGYGVSEEWEGWQLSHKKARRKARRTWMKNEERWNAYH